MGGIRRGGEEIARRAARSVFCQRKRLDMQKYLLGLDNGGTYIKAAIYDLCGREIAVHGIRAGNDVPHPNYVERDMDVMFKINMEAIRAVLAASGINGGDICAVGITAFGNGLLAVDENGGPVYPAIVSSDTRAQGVVDEWKRSGVSDLIFERIGHSVWAAQPLPLIAWLKRNENDAVMRARWFMSCKDYIRFKLTGEAYYEITDASAGGVMSHEELKLSDAIFSATDMADVKAKFAPFKRPDEICGFITEEIAGLTGLRPGTPVAGGLMDVQACALSSGILDDKNINIVLGSWGIHQCLSASRVNTPGLFMTARSYLPGRYLILEGSPTCANNIEWFIEHILRPAENADSSDVYAYCGEVLERIPPEASELIYLPFLFATNGVPHGEAAFMGMSGYYTHEHMLRAVYEGMVFSSRQHVDRLLKGRERAENSRVRLVGGGSRSKPWVQIYADVLQMPIEVMGGSFERGALGAAMIAGVACGAFESHEQATERMVSVSHTILPDETRAAIYESKYQRYRRALCAVDRFSNFSDEKDMPDWV